MTATPYLKEMSPVLVSYWECKYTKNQRSGKKHTRDYTVSYDVIICHVHVRSDIQMSLTCHRVSDPGNLPLLGEDRGSEYDSYGEIFFGGSRWGYVPCG